MPRTQNPRCDRSALLKSRLQPAAGHCPLALFCQRGRITDPTPIRLKPALQRNTIAVRTLLEPIANYIKPVPTTYGDIQPKNVRAGFKNRGKSTESTFPSSSATRSTVPRIIKNTFPSKPIYFPLQKCISNKTNEINYTHEP
jgi:hypothetical protein